jgi:nitrogen-specific signal transduction histidine kinase/CheY-like chemotaxis protein
VIGTGFNLTEKKQLQEQLLHAQKMDSIGRLAGGIAHDFNNILTTILGYGEILQIELKNNESAFKKIQTILQAGNKAAVLTDRLLTLSRKQVIKKQPNNINNLISDLMKIIKKVLRDDIEVRTFLKAEQCIADVDSGQLEQVFLNLALNAKDAMPNGGELLITTENADTHTSMLSLPSECDDGVYLKITVQDNGTGISQDNLNRIFDPFFTTKEPGKGTGLGLSTAYSIIKQHKGVIRVESTLGKGTKFIIYLPVCNEIPDTCKTDTEQRLLMGNETILIVDDDVNVLELLSDCLSFLGYKCINAHLPEDALRIAENYNENIDMLLTDVIMPKMDGRQLGEKIRKIYPDIIVVYMSGYSENIIADHGVLNKSVNYISKPITPKDLSVQIRHFFDKIQ